MPTSKQRFSLINARLLQEKTNANGVKASSMALAFAFISYLIFSFLVIQIYGDAVQPNIFDNLKEDQSLISYMLRVLFLFIFTFNLPYPYIIGKDSILTFITEFRDPAVSKKIMQEITFKRKNSILIS